MIVHIYFSKPNIHVLINILSFVPRRRLVPPQPVHFRPPSSPLRRGRVGGPPLLLRPGGRRPVLHQVVPRRDGVLPICAEGNAAELGLSAAGDFGRCK